MSEPTNWKFFASNVFNWCEARGDNAIPGAEAPPETRTEQEAQRAMGKALDKHANNSGIQFLDGVVEHVSAKTGTGKRGPWTLYGVKIEGVYYNTFDKTMGELAQSIIGEPCRFGCKQSAKGTGMDLTALEA